MCWVIVSFMMMAARMTGATLLRVIVYLCRQYRLSLTMEAGAMLWMVARRRAILLTIML